MFYTKVLLGSVLPAIESTLTLAQYFAVGGTYVTTNGQTVSLSYTKDDTFDIFKRYLEYGTYLSTADIMAYIEDHEGTTTNQAMTALFASLWNRWAIRNKQNLVDLFAVYTEGYDPLVP